MPLAAATASTDFIGAIQTALVDAGMLSDQIVVLDPQSAAISEYDPETDEGGESTPTLVLGPRPAYIKALGNKQYRIQFLPVAGDPIIKKGLIVRVLPGSRNPAHPHYAFSVLEAPSGSIAALTKLDCETTAEDAPVWSAP